MSELERGGLLKRAQAFFAHLFGAKGACEAEESASACCSGTVHVAFRGLSDDRLYMSRSRKWSDVRYFRQNGLRVFCADCRRRLV